MADVILQEQQMTFVHDDTYNTYAWSYVGSESALFTLVVGEKYIVAWDGVSYICEASNMSLGDISGVGMGNKALIGGEGSGEPFIFAYVADSFMNAAFSSDTADTTHTVSITKYEVTSEQSGVDIILYNRTGAAVLHKNTVTLTTETPVEGERVKFTYGVVAEGTEIDLALADGDQTVSVPAGSLLREATIKKPETLTPEHIKKGVDVAGVIGTFAGDEMEKTVALDMASGDQIVDADPDTVMTRVTVKKPETLVPENIVDGVDIGGVVGTQKDNAAGIIDGTASVVSNGKATHVMPYAFFGRSELTEVNLPACKTIGYSAFQGCSKLSKANFPVCEDVGTNAFVGCSSLEDVSFPKCLNVYYYAFSACSKLKNVDFPACEKIYSYAFSGCTGLRSISFPKCESVGYQAFSRCNLYEVEMENCKYIDHYAFCSNRNLSKISFPNVREVLSTAFDSCSALLSLESSVYYAGDIALKTSGTVANMSLSLRSGTRILAYGVFQTKSITGLQGMEEIEAFGTNALYNCGSVSFPIELPKAKYVGSSAFCICIKISAIGLPECSYIGGSAFARCSLLSEIYAPKVEKIMWGTFQSCSNLSKVNMHNVKVIDSYAFGSCSKLSKIFFPKCTSIATYAFTYCTSLQTAIFGENFSYSTYVFNGCNILSSMYLLGKSTQYFPLGKGLSSSTGRIYVRESLVDAYKSLFSRYSSSYFSKFVGMTDEEIKELYEQEGYTDETANSDTTV